MYKGRKSLTEHILDFLQEAAENGVDLLKVFFTSYPESYRLARRGMLGEKITRFEKDWSELYANKKRLYRLLYNLKRDGLIKKSKSNKRLWQITDKGKSRNQEQKTRKSNLVNLLPSEGIKKSKTVIVISYDIPEVFRHQRLWIRDLLKLISFSMIHKSVWVGTNLIPREFLKEIVRRGIADYIQIFEVTKRGTLVKIK